MKVSPIYLPRSASIEYLVNQLNIFFRQRTFVCHAVKLGHVRDKFFKRHSMPIQVDLAVRHLSEIL